MRYIKISNDNYPVSLSEIKAANPETSFPSSPTDAQLLPFDHANVVVVQAPSFDPMTHSLQELTPVYDGNQYNQVWQVTELSQPEKDENTLAKDTSVQQDMLSEGKVMTLEDDARLSTGAAGVIVDRPAHNTWMTTLYTDTDNNTVATPKPPPDERQSYQITGEDADPFTFTRYQDQWGYRWKMTLTREDVSALALYIQNSSGGYLYTTGALIDNGDGNWSATCPAGQADPTPEDVYFHWILGSGRISSDFVYKGSDDTLSGVVRSDPDYD